MPQKFSKEDLIYMIKACKEKGMGMNEWELNFIISINDYITKYGVLTPAQTKVLDRIYTEKVP